MACHNDGRFVVFFWKQSRMQKQLKNLSTGNEIGSWSTSWSREKSYRKEDELKSPHSANSYTLISSLL